MENGKRGRGYSENGRGEDARAIWYSIFHKKIILNFYVEQDL